MWVSVDKYYNYVYYILWEIYFHVSQIIARASFVTNDLQIIILCARFVIKRYTTSVNIYLIVDTIVIVAPYVGM